VVQKALKSLGHGASVTGISAQRSVECLKAARGLLPHHFVTQHTGMNSVFT
jgi:hypothetical protein